MKIKSFFTNEENRRIIAKSISEIDRIENDSEPIVPDIKELEKKVELVTFEKDRDESVKTILKVMLSGSIDWDKNCTYSINKIGEGLISRLVKLSKKSSKEDIDIIFSLCYRFLIEYYLSVEGEFDIEFERIRQLANNNIDYFEKLAQEQIRFVTYSLPIEIFKAAFNDENVINVKNFNKIHETSDKKLEQWKVEIQQSEERVEQLKIILQNHETAFNFVGLYDGFKGLADVKEKEKVNLIKWVRIAGIAIFLPMALDFYLIFHNINDIDELKRVALISFIPTATVIALLIYYFRILLHNLNEIKAQLLQIELRKTLCQFIQSYVDYSNRMKEKDQEALSKFESLIFSGIVSSNEKLPSTYDGLEKISGFIKALRKN